MLDRYFSGSETIEAAGVAELSSAIAASADEGRPIYPVGGGTSLTLGAAVSQPGTILSLRRLNRLVDYPSGDLTISVEAGMTMGQLAQHLSTENQRLPIDVARADTATVGGVVAANLSGPRRYRFGTVRDYLLGLTAIDGTGKSFSAGGRVVKNAAGYDLTRLMIGSLGTLGVITQATFMVRPKPEKSALAAIWLPALNRADTVLQALDAKCLEPTAVELVAGHKPPAALSVQAPASLWIGVEGDAAEVQWKLDGLGRFCRDQALEVAIHDNPEATQAIWQALTDHGSIVPADPLDTALTVEVTVLPSKSAILAERLLEWNQQLSIHCHAGSGVLVVRTACEPDQACHVAAEIRRRAGELGGQAAVTAWPPESRMDQQTVWGPPGGQLRVMQRIKRQFDPRGILNPGRFIFESASVHVPT